MTQFWTQYLVSILTEGAIFGIMALGLNVIWGWSGDFDLAYYGYVALGAYMTLVLTIGQPTPPTEYILGLQLPYLVALLGAVVSSALMGLIVGIVLEFAGGYISASYELAFAFAILALIILVRPRGLFTNAGRAIFE